MILALAGGVGGAKLSCGLQAILGCSLTVVVNTADDFRHLGLAISPDLDTVTYALAGISSRDRGWGLEDESWNFMMALERLGGESWFRLGDRDMATHVFRTASLSSGISLSAITDTVRRKLGVKAKIAPMTDQPVSTVLETDNGLLPFQDYFVKQQCAPKVNAVHFHGMDQAVPSLSLLSSLRSPELQAVVLCPSNPFLSIDPILALAGVRAKLRAMAVPVVAVSPIVSGNAIKGPAGKLFKEFGIEPSALSVAEHYSDFIDGFILDEHDADCIPSIRNLGIEPYCTNTVMADDADKIQLGQATIDLAVALRNAERIGSDR